MRQPISGTAGIVLGPIPAAGIDAANQSLLDLRGTMTHLGYGAEIATLPLPTVSNRGVQTSASGIVQDPAGSAVGSGVSPLGGGASGAIYAHFKDLDPVPGMKAGQAVFNSSRHDGGRVLHTHSPLLQGSSEVAEDATKALQDLANAYLNSFLAERMVDGDPPARERFSVFNAVPISGRIFAGRFRNPALDHLHPGYTVAAILIATAEMIRAGRTMPQVDICYFDRPAYARAVEEIAALRSR